MSEVINGIQVIEVRGIRVLTTKQIAKAYGVEEWRIKQNFYDRKENNIMRLFITKKKLIKKLAEELAYLQIRADWWYYVYSEKDNKEMSSKQLDAVDELRCICNDLGILKEVYDEAYKIYDFRNSGKKDYVPDVGLIKQLNRDFCEPRKKRRPLI